MIRFSLLLTALSLASTALAAPPVTPDALLKASPASDWRTPDPQDLLVLALPNSGRATILLAEPFAPEHVKRIRALARSGWYDGVAVERVQDDYVVQWGDDSKPAPPASPTPAEYERPAGGLDFHPLAYRDTFAARVGYVGAMPVAQGDGQAWLTHCYGMVGVGRDLNPDTGNGTELYAVIGHAPRALDRNIAVVGRVLEGMAQLAALPRGQAAMGFYAAPAERPVISRVRLAADLPPSERPAYQVLDPASATFRAWVHLRANRRDDFFLRPAGAVDLCNALPPVRPTPPT